MESSQQTNKNQSTPGSLILHTGLKGIALVSKGDRLTESKAIKAQLEREKREQERLARERHLQQIHDYQDTYWRQVEQAAASGTGPGYDEALNTLLDLRAAPDHFHETQKFQNRFLTWIRPHLRRPALLKRLQSHKFTLPET